MPVIKTFRKPYLMEKSTLLSEMFTKKTRNSKVTKHKPVKSAFETMDDYLIAFLKYYNNPITLSCLKEDVRTGSSKKMREFVEEYKAALIRLEQSGVIYARREFTTGRPKTIIALTSGYDYSA